LPERRRRRVNHIRDGRLGGAPDGRRFQIAADRAGAGGRARPARAGRLPGRPGGLGGDAPDRPRRPGNPIGWLLLTLLLLTADPAAGYAILDYRHHHGTLPLGWVALMFLNGPLVTVLMAVLLWLFPDGRPARATGWPTT